MDGIRRPIGFSTGALAGGDVARGLTLQREKAGTTAVEVSALREHELTGVPSLTTRLSSSSRNVSRSVVVLVGDLISFTDTEGTSRAPYVRTRTRSDPVRGRRRSSGVW